MKWFYIGTQILKGFSASLAIVQISKNGKPEISFALIMPSLTYGNFTVELMILLSDPMEKISIPCRARLSFYDVFLFRELLLFEKVDFRWY